jgi:phage terminase large subunit
MQKLNLNPKYQSLFQTKDRYVVITGGRGSGKSFAVTVFLALLTYEKDNRILFTRYTMTSASMSIIPEFVEKLNLMGVIENFEVTKYEIKNKVTGSSIYFSGIKTASGDQTAKLKSISGVNTFVLDEAEELMEEDNFDKIDYSIRSKVSANRVLLILNPTTKEHWVYQRFFQNRGIADGFNGSKNGVSYIHTTYLDNQEHLSESFVKQVEEMKVRRPQKYEHQIMGGWLQKAEGVVFEDWQIGQFNREIPISCFGLDIGFARDESVLTEVAVDKARKIIWVKEHFYRKGLVTSNIYDLCLRYAGKRLIVVDSSEPRLIAELNSRGLNCTATVKKKGSIVTGIALMQDYNINLDGENLVKEFNNYVWDIRGVKPRDAYNHGVDAMRYAVEYLLLRSNPKGTYVIR